jgi:Ca2+-binding RTX toxin-like protein
MKRFYSSKLRLISLITVVSVTFLFSFGQPGWANIIQCDGSVLICNGTPGDDIIFGGGASNVIHGLGGNDKITGNGPGADYMFGDDGNDVLYGTERNDGLYGGIGNDKYDGAYGDDTIVDESWVASPFVSNDDFISGGYGTEYIESGYGKDRIHAGPGDELIYPNGSYRDFSADIVDCGFGAGDRIAIYSGDGDTAVNCEEVENYDR